MARVLQRKKAMVHDLAEIHQKRFAASGVPVLYGKGSFLSNTLVDVAKRDGSRLTVQGERIFIATGSRASIPDVLGLREAGPMTHVETLDLEHVPNHLAILGGGYVGLETAQALARLGSRITIVEKGTRLLPHEDDDVSDAILEILKRNGIEILLDTNLQHVAGRSGEEVMLDVISQGRPTVLEVSDILVAAGRTPNTDRLNAISAGVELTERGHIKVNERLETTVENIWAMGDVAGSPMFTHVSLDDFRIVRDNLQGGDRSTNGRLIPYVLFTDPPLSRIGLTETQAKQQAIPHQVATIPMAAILRTRTLSETEGFAKIIVGHDRRILGFSALGVESSEMLAAVQTAMIAGLPYHTIRDTIYPHPTLSEGLGALLASINI
ncbi:FAD-dependent oxidoreductase [Bremerella alba]|uniref:Putative pyridine nucleotide-disulfide oxidoreductase RclA n=1 Tax=Bremerella alba TaxID=980252 RepID=A0A7V8VAB1_9BACT|nr:FAD-dependent oxidoreductase [Bremerella alba]MBA2117869.1 putative pyridine nucleotide-disulfide oxidoreductase RclA [Bremerella alba]